MLFKTFLLLALMSLIGGCVTESTKGSPLVEGTANPAATQKITGKIFCVVNRKHIAVNNAQVSVTKDGVVMFSTSTAADGSYMLPSSFEADGTYGLQAKASCGKTVSRKLPKSLQGEVKNENFILKK